MDNENQASESSRVTEGVKSKIKSRRLCFNILLLVISLSSVLVLGELALRVFRPQPLAGIMFTQDPKFGFWNKAKLRKKKFQSEPNTPFYAVTTDARGYRGRVPVPAVKEPEVQRIVVLGDSYTFGVGVENEETFPACLRELLGQNDIPDLERGSRRFEVVNAGCPGWGTENELAFWKTRGAELNPDLLVVAYYRNDLSDNMRHMLYREKDGELVFAPSKSLSRAKSITRWIPFYGFLSEHSHLMNLFRRAGARLMVKAPTKTGEGKAAVGDGARKGGVNSELEAQLKVYSTLMDALLSDAKARKVPVVLLLISGRNECQAEAPEDYLAVRNLADGWMHEGKVARVVDVRGALMAGLKEGGNLFIPGDGHYTAKGNRIVAEELAKAVRDLR